MTDNAPLKIGTAGSTSAGTVETEPSSGYLARGRLWHLIPDVSLRTRTGLAALAVVALIGVAASLGAIWMAAGPEGAPFLTAYIVSLCRPSAGASSREEAPFLAENRAAMTTMMVGMDIRPSGDVDRDFVDMMVPHHQGAIDMAAAVLRYGHNEKIRRLAQEIIVTQHQEIVAMRLAVGEPLPPSIPSPTVLRATSGN
jgi:hypothetical protein